MSFNEVKIASVNDFEEMIVRTIDESIDEYVARGCFMPTAREVSGILPQLCTDLNFLPGQLNWNDYVAFALHAAGNVPVAVEQAAVPVQVVMRMPRRARSRA